MSTSTYGSTTSVAARACSHRAGSRKGWRNRSPTGRSWPPDASTRRTSTSSRGVSCRTAATSPYGRLRRSGHPMRIRSRWATSPSTGSSPCRRRWHCGRTAPSSDAVRRGRRPSLRPSARTSKPSTRASKRSASSTRASWCLASLTKLADAPPRAVDPSALAGDDADRAVRLEDRGAHVLEIRDAMFASGHLDLLALDMLAIHVRDDELAILHEKRWLFDEQP